MVKKYREGIKIKEEKEDKTLQITNVYTLIIKVNKKDLKIVDKDFLIDSLQEHIRQANVQAEKKTAEELTAHEKEVLKSLTTDLNYKGKYKKDVI